LSEEGPELLHQLGVETHGLDPALTYVPHVMFNQVAGKIDPYPVPHQLGVETHGLDPALTYVPHVMFNQVVGNFGPYPIPPLLFDQEKSKIYTFL
jgi:hypothetical protein